MITNLLMLALFLLSSLAGLLSSQLIPWHPKARSAIIPFAFGLASAPFFAGFSITLVLLCLPGSGHTVHLAGTFLLLTALSVTAAFLRPAGSLRLFFPSTDSIGSKWNWLFGALLTACIVGFYANSVLFPITQNDALEYATVGRLLFELRTLSAYPALNPSMGSSGFFGPWTHPPLYVAMAYLMNVIQGTAETPATMRLISPWFALSATLLVYALGRLANRTTATVAALIFLSTPLFFIGASSSLIDALPVTGICLTFCSIVALEGSPVKKGLCQGLILGAALWTHSQAILFIPICIVAALFYNGWRSRSSSLLQITVLLAVAFLVAAWPYGRNIKLFGSLVSDNPSVFAMKKLGWVDYFRMARGLGSWSDRIQNGLLKGWFAFRSFSLSFWVMSLSFVLALSRIPKKIVECERWKLSAAGVMACYFGGVVLSLLLGIDLMIRNERYLLILLPFVSLFAGIGVSKIIEFRNLVRVPLLIALLVMLSAQLLVVGGHKMRSLSLHLGDISMPSDVKLVHWPAYASVDYLRRNTPPTAIVLSLKPADMYYAHRRMISYLDPRLLPFYDENDPHRALNQLRSLGIQYLHIPDYSLPSIYNSGLQDILSRTDLTKLSFSADGYQIYEVMKEDGTKTKEAPEKDQRAIKSIPIRSYSPPLFRWDVLTYFWSRKRDILGDDRPENRLSINAGLEYLLSLSLQGHAFARIHLLQYDSEGRLVDKSLIGEIVTDESLQGKIFKRRFKANQKASSACLLIEHQGDSGFAIPSATIALLDSQ